MRILIAPALVAGTLLVAAVPAEASNAQVRSALRTARAPVAQLEQTSTVRSLGVTFHRFRQVVGGVPVLGSGAVVTDAVGRRGDLLADRTRALGAPAPARIPSGSAIRIANLRVGVRALRAREHAELAILRAGGHPSLVWRVVIASAEPLGSTEVLVDASSGEIVRARDLLLYATGTARVFDPNPVVANGGTGGLSDSGDADSVLLTNLREARTLSRLDSSTCLRGAFVEAVLPPGDPDADTAGGDVCAPSRNFDAVTRGDNRFEALMAYFHIDRAQEYVQSLGFRNVLNRPIRANADAVIPGPATEAGQDNSFFDPVTGQLTFGTGFADDAEDGETIVHEYGHAIQDAQVTGFPASAEGAAIGEGFGDYLASTVASRYMPVAGFDGCFDEWDAFASGLGTCLRRVDWTLRVGQVSPDCPDVADEHCRGEVWAGALWAIRNAIGATAADRLVIQSQFSLTAAAGYDQASRALLAADQTLYGGTHRAFLQSVLGARGLVDVERLDDTPAEAVALGVPDRVNGSLSANGDAHDVYAVSLGGKRPVLVRLRASGSDYDLRLLPAGAVTVDAPPVAAAETEGGDEDIHYVPAVSGVYYIDVRAIAGSGPYTLEIGSDDGDGDGVADAADDCPGVRDARQRDWDRDGHGDLCDRSARVTITSVHRTGRRLRVRARMLPSALPARALHLAVLHKTCKRRHCGYKRGRDRRAARTHAGRVDVRFRLAPGRYRLHAELHAAGYRRAKSGTRSVLVH